MINDWLAKVLGKSWRVSLTAYSIAAWQLYLLFDGYMAGGMDWSHALKAAVIAFIGRILKEERVTGGTVPNTLEAEKRTTPAASAPSEAPATPHGKAPVILFPLLLVGLMTSACIPQHDPLTVQEFQAIHSKDSAAENCPAALNREQAKTDAAHDAKTIRHLAELCDCWARAQAPVELEACARLAASALAYEGEKKP